MYKDPKMVKLLLYQVQWEVEPGGIDDVLMAKLSGYDEGIPGAGWSVSGI